MQNQRNYQKNYGKEVYNVDEMEGTDIKINPNFYIHMAIVKVQNSFDMVDFKEGLERYQIFVSQLEIICKACDMLDSEYDDKIKDFKESTAFNEFEGNLKRIKLTEEKFRLLMNNINSLRTMTSPLKL